MSCYYCRGVMRIHDDYSWIVGINGKTLSIEIEEGSDYDDYYNHIDLDIEHCPKCGEKLKNKE